MIQKKKLIEVALPLEAISKAAAKEKSIRHGHPSTLHLWWSRKPLAACRAVLFAQLVDDPSAHPEKFPTDEAQERERKRLFGIIEELVNRENTNKKEVLEEARKEIMNSCDGNPPPVLDPFCGGGSIPLEAQRLGLEAHGSDLNPVPVLITKALIEIPPKFAGRPPVNPESKRQSLVMSGGWGGAKGLAEDVRYYGNWLRDEAKKRIGNLYPDVAVVQDTDGTYRHKRPDDPPSKVRQLTAISWLWARTVKCPNPACGAIMPLTSKFLIASKKGKEVLLEPIIDKARKTISFDISMIPGKPQDGTVNRRGARCLVCGETVTLDYVRSAGRAGCMGSQMLAIVAEGELGRVYLPPCEEHVQIAENVSSALDAPDTDLPEAALGFRVQNYGMTKHRHLFTNRQLMALTTFCDLVEVAHQMITNDSCGNKEYADSISVYLALNISKLSIFHCTQSRWRSGENKTAPGFSRQALPMVWDYAEANPWAGAGGDFGGMIDGTAKVILALPETTYGYAQQGDASQHVINKPLVISTDPPYYDNVPYADLSDFFYVWLRKILYNIYPDLFSTKLVPKAKELVADQFRHGGKDKASKFFEKGMGEVFYRMREILAQDFPATIYYAFKQSESEESDETDEDDNSQTHASTGWETMLEGLIQAGWQITGTWPIRTEMATRMRSMDSNALASSIVLVCRPRPPDTSATSRRDFMAALKRELPDALRKLQHGNIAPVDLAQAAIGPGMAVYSRYSKVLETDGSPLGVRTALTLINQSLDEVLAEQEGEFDADTRWAVAWFEQFGVENGQFGVAETLSKAKNTSVQGMVEAGVITASHGIVRLLRRDELPADWDPSSDTRITSWEIVQHLIRVLETKGEAGAAELLKSLGSKADTARDLAYRLYTICERKGWAKEAFSYNSIVIAWPEVGKLAAQQQAAPSTSEPMQPELTFT